MLQHKIDVIFKRIPNIFDIADDICIVGYVPMIGTMTELHGK